MEQSRVDAKFRRRLRCQDGVVGRDECRRRRRRRVVAVAVAVGGLVAKAEVEAVAVAAAKGEDIVAGLGRFHVLATVVAGGRCLIALAGVSRVSWPRMARVRVCQGAL